MRGHKAAKPWIRAAALGGLAAGLACIGVGLAVGREPGDLLSGAVTLTGYGPVVGLVIAAGTAANRAALEAPQ
ncbi:MAG: hypothetical protein ABTA24_08590 [Arthrobacter sp.]